MAKKVYAIKEGYDSLRNCKIENLIVNTWAECLTYVKGVKGAKYKSFESLKDAEQYLKQQKTMLKKGEDEYPEDCLHIYVDGSYSTETENYSYGFAAVKEDVVEYVESGCGKIENGRNIRQIAGELQAALKGAEHAIAIGEKKVVIIHDYEGISHHATGFWERREASSVDYFNKMQTLMARGLEIIFVKVDSHTGDLYNELVDELCKEKLGIKSSRALEIWLTSNLIKVSSQEIKDIIAGVAPGGKENIIIA